MCPLRNFAPPKLSVPARLFVITPYMFWHCPERHTIHEVYTILGAVFVGCHDWFAGLTKISRLKGMATPHLETRIGYTFLTLNYF